MGRCSPTVRPGCGSREASGLKRTKGCAEQRVDASADGTECSERSPTDNAAQKLSEPLSRLSPIPARIAPGGPGPSVASAPSCPVLLNLPRASGLLFALEELRGSPRLSGPRGPPRFFPLFLAATEQMRAGRMLETALPVPVSLSPSANPL